jgi:hypothetical protein
MEDAIIRSFEKSLFVPCLHDLLPHSFPLDLLHPTALPVTFSAGQFHQLAPGSGFKLLAGFTFNQPHSRVRMLNWHLIELADDEKSSTVVDLWRECAVEFDPERVALVPQLQMAVEAGLDAPEKIHRLAPEEEAVSALVEQLGFSLALMSVGVSDGAALLVPKNWNEEYLVVGKDTDHSATRRITPSSY